MDDQKPREVPEVSTDELLRPLGEIKDDQVSALIVVVRANTAAFKDIRFDLGHCNNQERVQAIIYKVEKAMEDLSMESQKIPPWVKAVPETKAPNSTAQYPIDDPINRDNPVPRVPEEQKAGGGKK